MVCHRDATGVHVLRGGPRHVELLRPATIVVAAVGPASGELLLPASEGCSALLGVGAACCPSAQPWRLAFFCALALCDFRYFSGYGGHTNFVLLYTAAAMVLPDGFARCGVLRAVVAHQLGSAGVHKLRVGGRAWLVRSHTSP